MTNILEYLGLEKTNSREMEQHKFFSELGLDQAGVVIVRGQPGSGKSSWAVSTAWLRRKLYHYPVVCNVLLKDAFGDYTYLSTDRLVEEFQKINKAVEKEAEKSTLVESLSLRDSKVASSAWEGSGVNLYKATVIFDEGYGSMDRRRHRSPKLILLSYLVQQWRHFGSLFIIIASSDELLDPRRILPYRTHFVGAATSFCKVYFRQIPVVENYNPRTQEIYVPNWAGRLFDSFCPVAVDRGILKSVLKENEL